MTKTAIINTRIFDGETNLDATTVVIEGATIVAIGGPIPVDAEIIDAHGSTVIPGLIDSHVHTSLEGLELAFTVRRDDRTGDAGHVHPEQARSSHKQ